MVSVAMPSGPWPHPQSAPAPYSWQEQNTDQASSGGEWSSSNGPEGTWPQVQNNGQWVAPSMGGHGGNMQIPPQLRQSAPMQMGQQHTPLRQKRRFCTSFPNVMVCRRGSTCAFAHSRDEIRAPLLSIEEENQDPEYMTDDFFMYKYKTLWCPIGVQHEWHTCVYAHNYQDARRPVSIGYGARLCPYWSKKDTGAEYSQRCPLGLRCPYSHGAKEQLYHPQYFKTVICRDLRGKACPRQGLCAFYHNRAERRTAAANDDIDYSQPLPEKAMHTDWMSEFLMPPFLPESSKSNEDMVQQPDGPVNGNVAMTPYASLNQAHPAPYSMQQPMVFLLPMPGPMSPQHGPAMMGSQNGNHAQPMQMGNQMGHAMNGQMANWVLVPMEGHQSGHA